MHLLPQWLSRCFSAAAALYWFAFVSAPIRFSTISEAPLHNINTLGSCVENETGLTFYSNQMQSILSHVNIKKSISLFIFTTCMKRSNLNNYKNIWNSYKTVSNKYFKGICVFCIIHSHASLKNRLKEMKSSIFTSTDAPIRLWPILSVNCSSLWSSLPKKR